MVVCPASYPRVEGGDEGGLIAAAMGADESFHLFHVTLLCLDAGLDDDLVATFAAMLANQKLPDGEAEKVKARSPFMLIKRVGDVSVWQKNPGQTT